MINEASTKWLTFPPAVPLPVDSALWAEVHQQWIRRTRVGLVK